MPIILERVKGCGGGWCKVLWRGGGQVVRRPLKSVGGWGRESSADFVTGRGSCVYLVLRHSWSSRCAGALLWCSDSPPQCTRTLLPTVSNILHVAQSRLCLNQKPCRCQSQSWYSRAGKSQSGLIPGEVTNRPSHSSKTDIAHGVLF